SPRVVSLSHGRGSPNPALGLPCRVLHQAASLPMSATRGRREAFAPCLPPSTYLRGRPPPLGVPSILDQQPHMFCAAHHGSTVTSDTHCPRLGRVYSRSSSSASRGFASVNARKTSSAQASNSASVIAETGFGGRVT